MTPYPSRPLRHATRSTLGKGDRALIAFTILTFAAAGGMLAWAVTL